ncbi:MAG TPA: hypothetical protein VEJ86_05090, partial [Candidatus Binataceae bacterium]|nr:hypothetical protein [Candidatus Binataceae bacterium]
MRHKIIGSTAALVAAVLFFCSPARCYDIQHPHPQDLTPTLQKSLTDVVSDEAGTYLDQQDENRSQGKNYVDLQPKFEYLPTRGPGGSLSCSVKLGG